MKYLIIISVNLAQFSTFFTTQFSNSKQSAASAILNASYPAFHGIFERASEDRKRFSFFSTNTANFEEKVRDNYKQDSKRASRKLKWNATTALLGKKIFFHVRQPGVEPGSTAWEAAMITVTPLSPTRLFQVKFGYLFLHYLTVV